jgi:hypothetical protein
VRPPAPLRQDLRAEDRGSDRHHLPAVQLDDDLLPWSPLPFRLVHDGPACATPGGDSTSDAPTMARNTDRLSDGTAVHAKPRGRRILGLRVAWRYNKPRLPSALHNARRSPKSDCSANSPNTILCVGADVTSMARNAPHARTACSGAMSTGRM